jgi:hypothetical protein
VIKNELSLSLFRRKGKVWREILAFVAEKFRIGYESATKAKGAGITLTDML